MDSMNSFADLQALQQPSLGQALTMQPQQQQPQQPAQGPPATPEEYGQRVQGWTDTLSEMLANPMVSVALLQMGAALSAGRSAPEAMADTAGAVGRAGALTDQYRRRQEGDEMLRRKAGLEEKRFGLDERELGMRERLTEAQIKNYERMARGGGGGGGGAGAGAGGAMSQLDVLTETLIKRRVADFQDQTGGPPTPADLAKIRIEARKDAEYAAFGKSKMEPTWNPASAWNVRDPLLESLEREVANALPESQREKQLQAQIDERRRLMAQQQMRDSWQPTQAQPQMPPPGGAQVLQPPNATATGPFDAPVASFKTEAEALAAANAGKIPMGPNGVAVVIVNGQRYRLRSK